MNRVYAFTSKTSLAAQSFICSFTGHTPRLPLIRNQGSLLFVIQSGGSLFTHLRMRYKAEEQSCGRLDTPNSHPFHQKPGNHNQSSSESTTPNQSQPTLIHSVDSSYRSDPATQPANPTTILTVKSSNQPLSQTSTQPENHSGNHTHSQVVSQPPSQPISFLPCLPPADPRHTIKFHLTNPDRVQNQPHSSSLNVSKQKTC